MWWGWTNIQVETSFGSKEKGISYTRGMVYSVYSKLYRYKQRKGRRHSEWDADGQTIILGFRKKRKEGY